MSNTKTLTDIITGAFIKGITIGTLALPLSCGKSEQPEKAKPDQTQTTSETIKQPKSSQQSAEKLERQAEQQIQESYQRFLPEGFQDLRLGMSFQEVKEVRPFMDTTGTQGEAYENLKQNGIFDFPFDDEKKVEYTFDQQNKLTTITFKELDYTRNIEDLFEKKLGSENKLPYKLEEDQANWLVHNIFPTLNWYGDEYYQIRRPTAEEKEIVEEWDIKDWPFSTTEAKKKQYQTAQKYNLPIEKELDLGDNVTLDMMLIPSGEFLMGTPGIKPQRKEIKEPFYLGKTEVTQEQYQAIVGNNPSKFKGPQKPAGGVNFYQAREFCQKLSQKINNKVRLPTEVEWEWASRAGSNTKWFFGEDQKKVEDYAWCHDINGSTHKVAQKKPSPWNLYDIYGNVHEWTSDKNYDPFGVIQKGGSYWLHRKQCNSPEILIGKPRSPIHRTKDDNGFRILMPIEKE